MTDWLHQVDLPANWRSYAITLAAMIVLTTLNLVACIFAREWALRNQTSLLMAGLIVNTVLFIVYGRVLKSADLIIVNIGWGVFLQVGLLVAACYRYGVSYPTGTRAAIVLIMALTCYLVLSPRMAASAPADSHRQVEHPTAMTARNAASAEARPYTFLSERSHNAIGQR